jgi:hypothetical protein
LLQVIKNQNCILPLSVNFVYSVQICAWGRNPTTVAGNLRQAQKMEQFGEALWVSCTSYYAPDESVSAEGLVRSEGCFLLHPVEGAGSRKMGRYCPERNNAMTQERVFKLLPLHVSLGRGTLCHGSQNAEVDDNSLSNVWVLLVPEIQFWAAQEADGRYGEVRLCRNPRL